ncbi:MAG: hypothetical protein QOF30_3640, partial [Acidimicrobiaceae bacterium]|nr:hypothetical protein [Acidimicrobiaceae bacterium]
AITPALDSWRPWPGFAALDQRAVSSVDGCMVADVTFGAVAVRRLRTDTARRSWRFWR